MHLISDSLSLFLVFLLVGSCVCHRLLFDLLSSVEGSIFFRSLILSSLFVAVVSYVSSRNDSITVDSSVLS